MVLPVIYLPTVALLDRHCYEFGRVMIQFYHKRSPKYEERKKKKKSWNNGLFEEFKRYWSFYISFFVYGTSAIQMQIASLKFFPIVWRSTVG